MALQGSEVKSLRQGKATLQDSFATVKGNELILHKMHIDPYEKATLAWNHDPKRDRKLLVHKRELRKLEQAVAQPRTTLVPLAVYWKNGIAKLELGVAKGKQQHDSGSSVQKTCRFNSCRPHDEPGMTSGLDLFWISRGVPQHFAVRADVDEVALQINVCNSICIWWVHGYFKGSLNCPAGVTTGSPPTWLCEEEIP